MCTLRDPASHSAKLACPTSRCDHCEDIGFIEHDIFERLRFFANRHRFRADYALHQLGFTAAAEAAAVSAKGLSGLVAITALYRPSGNGPGELSSKPCRPVLAFSNSV